MNFDHAESAVLATVHVAMPQGFALPSLNYRGLPDFELAPKEAREACNRLRLRGFVAKVGAYAQLTANGMALFVGLEEMISGGSHAI